MNGIEAICIDDTKRPKEIPSNKWVKSGNKYHITHIFAMLSQKGIKGVELAEIDISDCHPYNSFRLNRFVINPKDLEKWIQMCKDTAALNGIDIDSFVQDLINKEELILAD